MPLKFLQISLVLSAFFVISERAIAQTKSMASGNDCLIQNYASEFHNYPGECTKFIKGGATAFEQEIRVFDSQKYLVIAIALLGGPDTVWKFRNAKDILGIQWLKDQNAQFTRSAEKVVPSRVFGAGNAKSYDVSTRDFNRGCFAFSNSLSPSADDLQRSRYMFAALICAKNGVSIAPAERSRLSSYFGIQHKYYQSAYIAPEVPASSPKNSYISDTDNPRRCKGNATDIPDLKTQERMYEIISSGTGVPIFDSEDKIVGVRYGDEILGCVP